ncbi:MAG: hypothetical protein OEX22_00980 [Cyclobacteriaceae bacterium]|nr:hypothetical protein [Cyclobacteriaceae bacterium]
MTLFSQNLSTLHYHRAIIFIILLSISAPSISQDWYNALKSEHKRARFGVGIIASDPLGIELELFKGEFCSNGNGYKAATIWMLNLGVENIISNIPSFTDNVMYDQTGELKPGGMRGEFGVLLKLFSITADAFTVQFHIGPTIEGGSRKYQIDNDPTTSTFDIAGNGHARLTLTSSGVEVGHGLVFVSFHAGLKYQQVFNADYSYLKPTFGVVLRKVR